MADEARMRNRQSVHMASMMVRSEGVLSFYNGCEDGKVGCNGRGKQGKDALSVCAQGLCKDAKPTKHTQTLALRKARVIVRMRNQQSIKRQG